MKFTQIAAEQKYESDKNQNGRHDKQINLIFMSSDGFCNRNVIFCVCTYRCEA